MSTEPPKPYVSRGGIKLEGALRAFHINPTGWIALDIGASTGGFTDCLFKHGARKIYAVDVGYGQFDWKLRNDPRVVLLERTNARSLSVEKIPEPCDLAVADVSFISLTKILPALIPLVKSGGQFLLLVKPQFELGPGRTKKGVVRSIEMQQEAVALVSSSAQRLGLEVRGQCPAPIKGPKGNQEYFLHLRGP